VKTLLFASASSSSGGLRISGVYGFVGMRVVLVKDVTHAELLPLFQRFFDHNRAYLMSPNEDPILIATFKKSWVLTKTGEELVNQTRISSEEGNP